MKFENQLITPEVAKKIIESNTRNRRVDRNRVTLYSNEIKEGRWKSDTAETIKISKTGVVLDGQHRLHAVILANTPTYFVIASDLADDVFDVLDTGKSRTGADVFKIEGIKNDTIASAIIAAHDGFANGFRAISNKQYRLTNSQLLDEYYSKPVFWQTVVTKTQRWYVSFSKVLAPSIIGGLYAVFYKINQHDSDVFFEQLSTGLNIECDSIGLLRNKLIQDKISPKKMPAPYRIALIIKAWNHFRARKNDIAVLKFDPKKENYPQPI